MSKSNKTKSEFLGLPFGTACNQLRLQLLFKLVVMSGLNNCFKCSKPIETANELSVEHKKPWLHVDTKLFWDLENVTFSHRKCNTRDRVKAPRLGPDGTSWCSGCRNFRLVQEFTLRSVGKTGKKAYRFYCKTCRKSNAF